MPQQRQISAELQRQAEQCGTLHAVPAALHPEDFILWFIHDQAHMTDKAQAVREYFQSGKEGALFLQALLEEHRPRQVLQQLQRPGQPLSLLEFASGYGRVTRHLPAALPGFEVTASDIHPQAVEFLRGFGLRAVQSHATPEAFDPGRVFDVIYAFSFFTHMPRGSWGRWLKALGRHVSPGGLLVFSTHGQVSQGLMGVGALEPDGFFFHPVSEQKDLEVAEYGNTITTFGYVHHQLRGTDLRLVQFREAGGGHHDIYVLQRDPAAVGMAQDENALLRQRIEAIEASRSWKLTAPLRGLVQMMRGG